MKIANGIYMLEISANVMGVASTINPTLVKDDDSVILIDTGFPGQLPQIRAAIEREGVSFNKLNMVILTHQDIDHVGGVSDIVKELPSKVKVLAHGVEKPFIDGEKKPVKLAKLEEKLDYLPENMKIVYEKLKAGFQSCRVNVDKALTDGEVLPYCGGITVVYTPGHTPGHICLYHKNSRTLIAGDLLKVESGDLIPSPENINYDNELNLKSLKKLSEFDVQNLICYHGGLITDKVNKRIKELDGEDYSIK